MRWRAALVSMALVTLAGLRARAQGSPASAELATARALFEEGLAREDAKDWEGALVRFRRVAEIRVTPQVVFNIALCLEQTGKLASADKEYARAELEGARGPDPSQREVARLATEHRRQIHDRIASVVVEPPKDAGVTVTLDGAAFATFGSAVPMDAGAHDLVVTRGTAREHRSFVVRDGSRMNVGVPSLPPPSAAPSSSASGIPTAAWITGGITLAAGGVAVFALVSRSSAISDLDAACGPNRDRCPDDAHATLDRAHTMTALTNVSLAVAGAAALATVAFFVFAPSPKSASVAVSPAGVAGRF